MRPVENLTADRGRQIELRLEQCDRSTLADRRRIFEPDDLVDPYPVRRCPLVEGLSSLAVELDADICEHLLLPRSGHDDDAVLVGDDDVAGTDAHAAAWNRGVERLDRGLGARDRDDTSGKNRKPERADLGASRISPSSTNAVIPLRCATAHTFPPARA